MKYADVSVSQSYRRIAPIQGGQGAFSELLRKGEDEESETNQEQDSSPQTNTRLKMAMMKR